MVKVMLYGGAGLLVATGLLFGVLRFRGDGGASPPPSANPPRGAAQPSASPGPGYIKAVPCKIRLGGVAAELEVGVDRVKGLILDGKRLVQDIVAGGSDAVPAEKGLPVLLVVNKKSNRLTYLWLTPQVKEVRIDPQDAGKFVLVTKNQEPLQIELWVDGDKDVRIDVEFKDGVTASPR